MLDKAAVDSLHQAAKAETKRWGGQEPSLVHVAFAASRKWTEEFRAEFGEEGASGVLNLLQRKRFLGTWADAEVLFTKASSTRDFIKALHNELGPELTAQDETAATETSSSSDPVQGAASGASEWPKRTAELLERVEPRTDVLARDNEVTELLAQLTRPTPVLAALVGRRGAGRTTVLSALAAHLESADPVRSVWRIAGHADVGPNQIAWLGVDAPAGSVVVLDDFDSLARLDTSFPARELLQAAIQLRGATNTRFIFVLDERHVAKLGVVHAELGETLVPVTLAELPRETVERVFAKDAAVVAAQLGVNPTPELTTAALLPPTPKDFRTHPGLAMARLEPALARASVAGVQQAEIGHLSRDASTDSVANVAANLSAELAVRIKGQSEAIIKVSERLAITRANLDLRPERPNGVFLFVGPTGVGKTELAREIALHEYGGYDHLIRLDMSEFAQEWAISRLAGPMPGYVGSDEPSEWLTTKVAAKPRSVILLDEIEKAHPRVWNIFLQVFDAGRLTDSRGITADFRDTVVILTSNLGLIESNTSGLGFTSDKAAGARLSGRILQVVKEQMAPELVNRMDELIVFNSLSMEAITEIAHVEMDRALEHLAAAGWSVTIADGVIDHLAQTGYDAAFGARHLQRNIEREFLSILAKSASRKVTVRVQDGVLVGIASP